ncbi:integrase domain-containing protein [Vibrio astriarenae]
MARITKPLTNTEVKQSKSKDKVYNLSDGEGLALRIKPNGSKLWLFDYYRPYTKKRTCISFGSYPELSLAEARKKKVEARALLAQKIDPKTYREETERAISDKLNTTLIQVAKDWFALKSNEVTPSYAEDIWRSLELHVFPAIGDMPIDAIKATHAIETMKPLAAKGSLETIKRVAQRLNEIMVFAVNTGLIQANLLTGIKAAFKAPTKKHMPTLKPEELPELMKALNLASIKRTTRCLIEWQLHTITRPSEAAGARWDEIDIESKLWNIPAERMKKRKPHSIPLSPQAISLLDLMRPISGSREFIFSSDRDPKKHLNEQTANMALKRMGFAGKLVSHGLRALASTTLNEQGFDGDIIESALAHVDSNEVRRAYNRADYIARRRVLMCWWSEHIEQAATGKFSLSSAKGHLAVVGAN